MNRYGHNGVDYGSAGMGHYYPSLDLGISFTFGAVKSLTTPTGANCSMSLEDNELALQMVQKEVLAALRERAGLTVKPDCSAEENNGYSSAPGPLLEGNASWCY